MGDARIRSAALVFCIHPIPYLSFPPICSSDCGDIVGTDHRGGLVKLNDRGHKIQHHTSRNRFSERSRWPFIDSMLSLPGGTEQG
jgi:hypothetical protein